MKKGLILIILSFVLIAGLASAYGYMDFRGAANDIIDWINQIFGPFFAALFGVSEFDQHLFARILLLILVYVVSFLALKKAPFFKDQKAIPVIVSLIISILGVRFLSESSLIDFILLPYGTVFIAISVFLPFFIYFFFIESVVKGSGLGRRLAWILFAAIFLGLWFTRQEELDSTGQFIYILGIIFVAIAILFDGKIHEYLELFEGKRQRKKFYNEQIAEIDRKIGWAIKAGAETPEAKKSLENYHKTRDELVRERGRV